MAKSINQVTLCGRLGGDPNVRVLDNGTKVCNFSLATGGDEYTTKDGREVKVPTQWHSIVCWRTLADFAEKALKKGSAVTVIGEINYREYQDTNGVKRMMTDIVATDLFMGGAPMGNSETNNKTVQGGNAQNSQADPFQGTQPEPQRSAPAPANDGLPF